MKGMNSRLMLIMPFLFPPTASFVEKTIHSVTEMADGVYVLILLTIGLERFDIGVERCIFSRIVKRT